MVLALSLDLARRNLGSLHVDDQGSFKVDSPVLRVLVPGLGSALDGRGLSCVVAVLVPVGCVVAWQMAWLGLHAPLSLEAGREVHLLVICVVLGVWLTVRAVSAWLRAQ